MKQFSIGGFGSGSKAWASQLETMLAEDEAKANQSSSVFVVNTQTKIVGLQSKLQRLLDGYLDQDIEREVYVSKKAQLMSDKKSLEEQSSKLTLASSAWVEPMKRWIETAVSICKTTESDDLVAKKSLCLEIFGSNLFLKNKKAQPPAAQEFSPPSENIWFLLRKTKEKIALSGDNSSKSLVLVHYVGKNLHVIRDELNRWREILEVPYQEYLRG